MMFHGRTKDVVLNKLIPKTQSQKVELYLKKSGRCLTGSAAALASLTGLFFLNSCSKGSDPQVLGRLGAEKATAGTGCIQGIVVDGFSGEKLNLVEKKASIFVLVNSSKVNASILSDDTTKGEYFICGVPVEQNFPLYAVVDGFEQFYGNIKIESSVQQRSPQATEDLKIQVPTMLGNIRVFPKGSAPQDLTFSVYSNGIPVSGAIVKIAPQLSVQRTESLGSATASDFFVSVANSRAQAFNATTDASGLATFSKDNLTLGLKYGYVVFPPSGGADQATAVDSFFLGLGNAGDPTNASDASFGRYKISVNLPYGAAPLAIVSTSRDFDNVNATGELKVVFNRDIEIVPGTADGIVATLSGVTPSSALDLADDVKGNNASESAVVSVSGNTLTLTPAFESAAPTVTSDPAAVVTYSGMQVRVVASPKNDHVLAVDTALSGTGKNAVSFFGGQVSNLQFASSVKVTSGTDQFFGTAVTDPTVSVTVRDSVGNLLSGVPVQWSIEDGAGFIGNASGASTVRYSENTSSNGVSDAVWTKSKFGGYFKATARVGNLDPVYFYYNVSGIKEIKMESAAASAPKGTELGAAVIVTVLDQDGVGVNDAEVKFFVEEKSGSIDKTAANATTPTVKEKIITDIKTDSTGQAKIFWTLGADAGEQKLYAKVDNFNVYVFKATAE